MTDVTNIVKKREFDNFIKKNKTLVIVFYGAKWCEACTEIYPMYERIQKKYSKIISMCYVDITDAKLDFSSIPVFESYYNGKSLISMIGADVPSLKDFIKESASIAKKQGYNKISKKIT